MTIKSAFALILIVFTQVAWANSQVDKILKKFEGKYQVLPGGHSLCPRFMKIELKTQSTLTITNTDPAIGTPYPKMFARVGDGVQRENDDFGTYIDYLTKAQASPNLIQVDDLSRNCGGVGIVKCNDWVINQTFQGSPDRKVMIKVYENANKYDYSKFPKGECPYTWVEKL